MRQPAWGLGFCSSQYRSRFRQTSIRRSVTNSCVIFAQPISSIRRTSTRSRKQGKHRRGTFGRAVPDVCGKEPRLLAWLRQHGTWFRPFERVRPSTSGRLDFQPYLPIALTCAPPLPSEIKYDPLLGYTAIDGVDIQPGPAFDVIARTVQGVEETWHEFRGANCNDDVANHPQIRTRRGRPTAAETYNIGSLGVTRSPIHWTRRTTPSRHPLR